jgi:hypothetical protein
MPPARCGQHPRDDRPEGRNPPDCTAYDPSAVPEWARETIALIAREHPQDLACHLDRVAEIEAAKRHTAGHPPSPPMGSRDLLHLSAIQAWQVLARGQPAPGLDPDLEQVIYEAFVTSDGHHVDQLCEGWLETARRCGIAVDDEHGDLLPDVLDAISHTVSAAIWFGLTTGYLTLTGSYHIPRKLLPQ